MAMAHNKVFVAGGSKGVGRELVGILLAQGKDVVALVRSSEAVDELTSAGATAIQGDACVYKAVEGAMDGCDAVVTTLGGKSEAGHRVDYEGNRNVIEAAGILGVNRLVLVTSLGCGDSKDAISETVYSALEEALVAKDKVEKMLVKFYSFSTDWTIIRPGGLVSEAGTGQAILTADPMANGMIHRHDVADLIARSLDNKETIKKTFTAVDPSLDKEQKNNSGEEQRLVV